MPASLTIPPGANLVARLESWVNAMIQPKLNASAVTVDWHRSPTDKRCHILAKLKNVLSPCDVGSSILALLRVSPHQDDLQDFQKDLPQRLPLTRITRSFVVERAISFRPSTCNAMYCACLLLSSRRERDDKSLILR